MILSLTRLPISVLTFIVILSIIFSALFTSALQTSFNVYPTLSELSSKKICSFSDTYYSRVSMRQQLNMTPSHYIYISRVIGNPLYSKSLGMITLKKNHPEIYPPTSAFKFSLLILGAKNKILQILRILLASSLMFISHMTGPLKTPAKVLTSNPLLTSASSVCPKKIPLLIEKYIQQNMFNDDVFDPFESAYREAIHDGNTGSHSLDLYLTASTALGKDVRSFISSPMFNPPLLKREYRVFRALSKSVDYLHSHYGISRNMSYLVIFGTGAISPILFIGMALLTFSFSQRAMTERMAVERYGESVLDATELTNDCEDDDSNQRNNTMI